MNSNLSPNEPLRDVLLTYLTHRKEMLQKELTEVERLICRFTNQPVEVAKAYSEKRINWTEEILKLIKKRKTPFKKKDLIDLLEKKFKVGRTMIRNAISGVLYGFIQDGTVQRIKKDRGYHYLYLVNKQKAK